MTGINIALERKSRSKSTVALREDIKAWLILFIMSTVCLMLVSPDSYLHDMTRRHDSAWFFMCGKAWFSGMTPYIEFSDSKGLLLWLIYGIGYLITPTSYIGVFWLSCVAYSFTLYICYKIGALVLRDNLKGLLTGIIMMIPYMLWWFHYETRAEDWCHPFCAVSLLVLLSTIYGQCRPTFHGLLLGISLGGTLMIKWSIAVMLLSIVVSMIIITIRQRQSYKRLIVSIVAGFFLMCMPFVLYMLYKGCLSEFVKEYFLVTAGTVSRGSLQETIMVYWWEIKHLAFKMRFVYVIYLFLAFLWWWYDKKVTLYPFLCGCFFLMISIHHDFHYYITIVTPFAIWSVLWLQKAIGKWQTTPFGIAVVVLCCLLAMRWNMDWQDNLIWLPSERRVQFEEINELMSHIESPSILHSAHETGLGIAAHTLPAIKYWAKQSGGGKDMDEAMYQAIREGKPDFVTVQLDGYRQDFADCVENSGIYEPCAIYRNHSEDWIEVWAKKDFKLGHTISYDNYLAKEMFPEQE